MITNSSVGNQSINYLFDSGYTKRGTCKHKHSIFKKTDRISISTSYNSLFAGHSKR